TDVLVVLGRLPFELWQRLCAVHFNDRGRGAHVLGYVNRGHREITLCALPPRMTFGAFIVKRPSASHTPEEFGAKRGQKGQALSIRRFMLYEVFLHELGHLQLVNENGKSERLRFAREKLANDFAREWRKQLWSATFVHADPVHNAPGAKELSIQRELA